jgi:hypothetical protein
MGAALSTAPAKFLLTWGSGSGNAQFTPRRHGHRRRRQRRIADTYNDRIQKFTGHRYPLSGARLAPQRQLRPRRVATDAAGNVYVADVYNNRIQKFTGTGSYLAQWGSLGSGNGQFHYPYGVATDATGNVYVADTYNNRIQKFVSPPAIALVSDVGNDQGKQAQLRVLRNSADSPGAGVTITGYEVYRRNDPLPAGPTQSAEPMAIHCLLTERTSLPAHGEAEYNAVVPTLANANASSLYYTAFMVRAVTSDPFTFYDSEIENGFSIDNLSPPAPSQFLAAYASGATHLHWGVSPATDFASFRLYRGSSSGFVPGPGTFVAETTDTGYGLGCGRELLQDLAVDYNGNERVAVAGPAQTTDACGEAVAAAFALDDAPTRDRRRLMVHPRFDRGGRHAGAARRHGRRVTERAVGSPRRTPRRRPAEGRRLEPGVYLVRLTQGASTTRHVAVIEKRP